MESSLSQCKLLIVFSKSQQETSFFFIKIYLTIVTNVRCCLILALMFTLFTTKLKYYTPFLLVLVLFLRTLLQMRREIVNFMLEQNSQFSQATFCYLELLKGKNKCQHKYDVTKFPFGKKFFPLWVLLCPKIETIVVVITLAISY